jgi:ribonuclease HIII
VSSEPIPLHSYTTALTAEQAATLRAILQDRGFKFVEKPYTLFSASRDKLQVTVYQKGPKVLLQGRGLEDFIQFTLEPEVLGTATFGYEEELHPERFEPHFGIDETGKGDFFGPLVIAGVYVDADLARRFRELGIVDSKRITTDGRIRELAKAIRSSRAPLAVITLVPRRYNELQTQFRNLNYLLARGHARVIEELCEKVPDCPAALSDQFARPAILQAELKKTGRKINLRQQTKAESDPAVAAASILARERLINWFEDAAKEHGETTPYPRGASAAVKQRAIDIVRARGKNFLPQVVKMHFKTAGEVLAAVQGVTAV